MASTQKTPNSDNVIDITKRYKNHSTSGYKSPNNKNHKSSKNRRKKRRKRKNLNFYSIVGGLVIILVMIFILWIIFHKNAYQIYLDDTAIGVIKEKDMAKTIYDTVKSELQATEGVNINFDKDYKVTQKFIRASKKDIVSVENVKTTIKGKVAYTVQATAISVDGVEIAVVKNEQEFESAKQKIEQSFNLEGVTNTSFVEDVQTSPKYVNKADIITSDELYNKLTSTIEVEEAYEVQSGDNLSLIANRYNTTVDQITNLNADITSDTRLKIGQKIKLMVPKPIVSVQMVVETKKTKPLKHEVQYQENSSQYKTYKKTVQEGEDGVQEIIVTTTYLNGRKQGEQTADGNITKEPVATIIEVGTKEVPVLNNKND